MSGHGAVCFDVPLEGFVLLGLDQGLGPVQDRPGRRRVAPRRGWSSGCHSVEAVEGVVGLPEGKAGGHQERRHTLAQEGLGFGAQPAEKYSQSQKFHLTNIILAENYRFALSVQGSFF